MEHLQAGPANRGLTRESGAIHLLRQNDVGEEQIDAARLFQNLAGCRPILRFDGAVPDCCFQDALRV